MIGERNEGVRAVRKPYPQQAQTGWRRGEGGRAGYAPYNATPERNHWLGTATGSLHPHEAPRFGRLRLPQLGAGLSRNGSVELPDARRGGIFLRSLQPGHLTLVGIRTSGPYRVCAAALTDSTPTLKRRGIHGPPCMRARADFAKSAIWRRGWA